MSSPAATAAASRGPVRVDRGAATRAAEVGDEPLLLAAFAPGLGRRATAPRRPAPPSRPAREALVLDDGFQNPALAKDLSIVVVDAGYGFGNGRGHARPAPCASRSPTGLARADLVLAIGDPTAARRASGRLARPRAPPILGGDARAAADRHGLDAACARCAFAGIGRPEKFFATLRDLGAEVVAAHALRRPRALRRRASWRGWRSRGRSAGAQLVTTEKDAVRLPPAFRAKVLVLPVRLVLDDWRRDRRRRCEQARDCGLSR